MQRLRYAACLLLLVMGVVFVGCSGSNSEAGQSAANGGDGKTSASNPSAADLKTLGGTWGVGGLYYQDKLVDVNDIEGLASTYDTDLLTFNDDGSFVHMAIVNERGTWSRNTSENDRQFLLDVDSTFMYEFKEGSLTEGEPQASDKQYMATLLDENTLSLLEFDESTGETVADSDISGFVYVRQGEESSYIAKNKIKMGSKSGAGASTGNSSKTESSSSQSHSNAGANGDDDFHIVDSGYDDANGKGYKGSDGYYYYVDDDGSYMATDGFGTAVKDVDGDGEGDYYTTDSGETWHKM